MKNSNLIEITKDLLYETWIDQPVFFTNILYNSLVKNKDKEVERFRLFQVLEKVSSAVANTAHIKEIAIHFKLGKFRYDLVIINGIDRDKKSFLTVGFPEDFEVESEPEPVELIHDIDKPVQKKSRIIEDHYFSYFHGIYLSDKETANKLYHCSMKDFYRVSIVTEYEPGKRFYFAKVKTSILPNTDRTLYISDYREKYLQVTQNHIIQKGLIAEKRKQVPFYELHTVMEALSEEDRPSLEDLFDIYDPRLKFTINFPPGMKYPCKMVIKKRGLYSAEDMAGYILKGMQKKQAADLLLNLDCDDSSSRAIIAAICMALGVSKNPDNVNDRLLNQQAPYSIDPIFKTPYREGIVLADRLGYQVNWRWPLEVWEQKTDKWENEEEDLLTLLPEVIDNPPSYEELRGLIEELNNDDIPF